MATPVLSYTLGSLRDEQTFSHVHFVSNFNYSALMIGFLNARDSLWPGAWTL